MVGCLPFIILWVIGAILMASSKLGCDSSSGFSLLVFFLIVVIIGLIIGHLPPLDKKVLQWQNGLDGDFFDFLKTASAEDVKHVLRQHIKIEKSWGTLATDAASKNPDKEVLDIIRKEFYPETYGKNLWNMF